MIRCGITGHNGVLGKKIQKILAFKFYRFNGDITNQKDIYEWLSKYKFDLIIHLAAIVPTYLVEKNFKKSSNINYLGSKYLVDLILKKKNKKWFFFSSTSHVYPLLKNKKKVSEKELTKPQSKYGLTKLKAEKYIIKKMKNKIPYCIGRIFSYTDTNQDDCYLIPSIYKKIHRTKNNKSILFSDLNHFRDFISTRDIVHIIKSLWINKADGIFNIASGVAVDLKKIPVFFIRNLKKKIKIEFKDAPKKTYLIANINKLKKLNIRLRDSFEDILKNFLKH